MWGVSILFVFTIIQIDFRTVLTVSYIYLSKITTLLHRGHLQAGDLQCVKNISMYILYILQYKIKIDIVFFVFHFILWLFTDVESYSFTTEANLRSLLYTGYEVKSRPSANVAVTLTFMPIALNELVSAKTTRMLNSCLSYLPFATNANTDWDCKYMI